MGNSHSKCPLSDLILFLEDLFPQFYENWVNEGRVPKYTKAELEAQILRVIDDNDEFQELLHSLENNANPNAQESNDSDDKTSDANTGGNSGGGGEPNSGGGGSSGGPGNSAAQLGQFVSNQNVLGKNVDIPYSTDQSSSYSKSTMMFKRETSVIFAQSITEMCTSPKSGLPDIVGRSAGPHEVVYSSNPRGAAGAGGRGGDKSKQDRGLGFVRPISIENLYKKTHIQTGHNTVFGETVPYQFANRDVLVDTVQLMLTLTVLSPSSVKEKCDQFVQIVPNVTLSDLPILLEQICTGVERLCGTLLHDTIHVFDKSYYETLHRVVSWPDTAERADDFKKKMLVDASGGEAQISMEPVDRRVLNTRGKLFYNEADKCITRSFYNFADRTLLPFGNVRFIFNRVGEMSCKDVVKKLVSNRRREIRQLKRAMDPSDVHDIVAAHPHFATMQNYKSYIANSIMGQGLSADSIMGEGQSNDVFGGGGFPGAQGGGAMFSFFNPNGISSGSSNDIKNELIKGFNLTFGAGVFGSNSEAGTIYGSNIMSMKKASTIGDTEEQNHGDVEISNTSSIDHGLALKTMGGTSPSNRRNSFEIAKITEFWASHIVKQEEVVLDPDKERVSEEEQVGVTAGQTVEKVTSEFVTQSQHPGALLFNFFGLNLYSFFLHSKLRVNYIRKKPRVLRFSHYMERVFERLVRSEELFNRKGCMEFVIPPSGGNDYSATGGLFAPEPPEIDDSDILQASRNPLRAPKKEVHADSPNGKELLIGKSLYSSERKSSKERDDVVKNLSKKKSSEDLGATGVERKEQNLSKERSSEDPDATTIASAADSASQTVPTETLQESKIGDHIPDVESTIDTNPAFTQQESITKTIPSQRGPHLTDGLVVAEGERSLGNSKTLTHHLAVGNTALNADELLTTHSEDGNSKNSIIPGTIRSATGPKHTEWDSQYPRKVACMPLESAQLVSILTPFLKTLGDLIARKSRELKPLFSICDQPDDTIPELQKGSLLLGKFYITDHTRLSRSRVLLTLRDAISEKLLKAAIMMRIPNGSLNDYDNNPLEKLLMLPTPPPTPKSNPNGDAISDGEGGGRLSRESHSEVASSQRVGFAQGEMADGPTAEHHSAAAGNTKDFFHTKKANIVHGPESENLSSSRKFRDVLANFVTITKKKAMIDNQLHRHETGISLADQGNIDSRRLKKMLKKSKRTLAAAEEARGGNRRGQQRVVVYKGDPGQGKGAGRGNAKNATRKKGTTEAEKAKKKSEKAQSERRPSASVRFGRDRGARVPSKEGEQGQDGAAIIGATSGFFGTSQPTGQAQVASSKRVSITPASQDERADMNTPALLFVQNVTRATRAAKDSSSGSSDISSDGSSDEETILNDKDGGNVVGGIDSKSKSGLEKQFTIAEEDILGDDQNPDIPGLAMPWLRPDFVCDRFLIDELIPRTLTYGAAHMRRGLQRKFFREGALLTRLHEMTAEELESLVMKGRELEEEMPSRLASFENLHALRGVGGIAVPAGLVSGTEKPLSAGVFGHAVTGALQKGQGDDLPTLRKGPIAIEKLTQGSGGGPGDAPGGNEGMPVERAATAKKEQQIQKLQARDSLQTEADKEHEKLFREQRRQLFIEAKRQVEQSVEKCHVYGELSAYLYHVTDLEVGLTLFQVLQKCRSRTNMDILRGTTGAAGAGKFGEKQKSPMGASAVVGGDQDLGQTRMGEPGQKSNVPEKGQLGTEVGLDVKQLMKNQLVSPPEVDIVVTMLGVCRALEFIHRLGIVHCNICPKNIFLKNGDFSKVLLTTWHLAMWSPERVFGYASSSLEDIALPNLTWLTRHQRNQAATVVQNIATEPVRMVKSMIRQPSLFMEDCQHLSLSTRLQSGGNGKKRGKDFHSAARGSSDAPKNSRGLPTKKNSLQNDMAKVLAKSPTLSIQGNAIKPEEEQEKEEPFKGSPGGKDKDSSSASSGVRSAFENPDPALVRDLFYLAPEQIASVHPEQVVGPRSDIYSLGCVLFECAALVPPFVGWSSGMPSLLTGVTRLDLDDLPQAGQNTSILAALPPWLRIFLEEGFGKADYTGNSTDKAEGVISSSTGEAAVPGSSTSSRLPPHISSPNTSLEALKNHLMHIPNCILQEHCSAKMLCPNLRSGHTSNDFIDIVEGMLRTNINHRPNSISELKYAFSKLLRDIESLPEAIKAALPHLRYGMRNTLGMKNNVKKTNALMNPTTTSSPSSRDDPHIVSPSSKIGGNVRREILASRLVVAQHGTQQGVCLDLTDEQRTDFTSSYLGKFATQLTVDEVRVGEGIIPLRLIRDRTTRVLKLRERRLSSYDVTVLARGLQHANSDVRELDLSGNFIVYESEASARVHPFKYHLTGIIRLTDLIAKSLPLTHLELSGNSLGPEGGSLLCSSLRHCETLVSLRLAFCEIGDTGGLALASSIPPLKDLQLVDISYNYIGNYGLKGIASSLKRANELENLSLMGNALTDGKDLRSALDRNFSIRRLALGRNDLDGKHFERCIEFNCVYAEIKRENLVYEGFGHNLMIEQLKRWVLEKKGPERRKPKAKTKPSLLGGVSKKTPSSSSKADDTASKKEKETPKKEKEAGSSGAAGGAVASGVDAARQDASGVAFSAGAVGTKTAPAVSRGQKMEAQAKDQAHSSAVSFCSPAKGENEELQSVFGNPAKANIGVTMDTAENISYSPSRPQATRADGQPIRSSLKKTSLYLGNTEHSETVGLLQQDKTENIAAKNVEGDERNVEEFSFFKNRLKKYMVFIRQSDSEETKDVVAMPQPTKMEKLVADILLDDGELNLTLALDNDLPESMRRHIVVT